MTQDCPPSHPALCAPQCRRSAPKLSVTKLLARLAALGAGLGLAIPGPTWAREGDPIAQVYLDDVVVSEENSEVELRLRVLSAYGEPIEDLSALELTVHDAGQEIDPGVLELSPQDPDEAPLTSVIALDTRVIGQGEAFDRARTAILQILNHSDEEDRIAVVTFGNEPTTVVDFGTSREDARTQLEQHEATAGTAPSRLFDNTYRSLALTRETPDLPRRRFAIVISDGRDEGSQRKIPDIVALARGNAQTAPLPVFSIGHAPEGPENLRVLANLSQQTGAGYFRANSTIHLPAISRGIWNQMKNAYVARYDAEMDGEIHEISLRGGPSTATRQVRFPVKKRSDIAWLPLLAGCGLLAVVFVGVGVARRSLRSQGSLVFETGDRAGEAIRIRKKPIRIGALRGHNDIVIVNETASRRHAILRPTGGSLKLEDLGSTNGTWVNGQRVEKATLVSGDRIQIAGVTLRYET